MIFEIGIGQLTSVENSLLPGSKRGPNPNTDWVLFSDALGERYFDNDGLTASSADDERWATDWFLTHFEKVPAESLIWQHVKEARDRHAKLKQLKVQANKGR